MVLQAPPRFHSPGFLGLGVLGTQKKRPFFSSPFPFHSMSMWSFFETGRREWGTLGERVGEEPPPPQVATPLSSIPLLLFLPFSRPFYFFPSSSLCSSISLSRISDHGLWGRSLFSCYREYPVMLSCSPFLTINKPRLISLFILTFWAYQATPPRTTTTPSYTPPVSTNRRGSKGPTPWRVPCSTNK